MAGETVVPSLKAADTITQISGSGASRYTSPSPAMVAVAPGKVTPADPQARLRR